MSKAVPIGANEPRPWCVFTPNGYVDAFTSESAAESFARAASRASALVYRVFHQTAGQQLRFRSEFANGRKRA